MKQKTNLDVVDEEGEEAVGAHKAGLLVRTITDVGHEFGTLVTTTNFTINTLRASPRTGIETLEAIRVVTLEGLTTLLNNGSSVERLGHSREKTETKEDRKRGYEYG
jgi:hypothetical protein